MGHVGPLARWAFRAVPAQGMIQFFLKKNYIVPEILIRAHNHNYHACNQKFTIQAKKFTIKLNRYKYRTLQHHCTTNSIVVRDWSD
jgi:hypothetical protein